MPSLLKQWLHGAWRAWRTAFYAACQDHAPSFLVARLARTALATSTTRHPAPHSVAGRAERALHARRLPARRNTAQAQHGMTLALRALHSGTRWTLAGVLSVCHQERGRVRPDRAVITVKRGRWRRIRQEREEGETHARMFIA